MKMLRKIIGYLFLFVGIAFHIIGFVFCVIGTAVSGDADRWING